MNIISRICCRTSFVLLLLAQPWCVFAQESSSSATSVESQPALQAPVEKQVLPDELDVNQKSSTDTQSDSEVSSVTQSRPMWEFGIGGGYFSGYDYPASKDRNQRAVVLPYFIYRTPKLRFGGGGFRAVAIENPRVKLDLSIGGSLNSSSEGNSVRDGMPNLDFLFEIGPQLEVRLLDRAVSSGGRLKARFSSELRAVFVTDFGSVGSQGVAAGLKLDLIYQRVKGSRVNLISSVSSTFASEKLQDYFYQVAPEFANATRAEFDAKGGYLESRVFVGIGFQPLKNVGGFLGVFGELYEGARNQDSPLFETTSEAGFVAGFVWRIKSSDTMVEVVELGGSE